MTLALELRKRQLVPRWRAWRLTALLGEIASPPSGGEIDHRGRETVERLFREFEQKPDIGHAGDLLSAAAVTGDRSDKIMTAAAQVAKDEGWTMVGELAHAVLLGDQERVNSVFEVEPADSRNRANGLRSVLRKEPRNAVRWVDLGREYLIMGQAKQAEQAVRIALNLAPESRFVLRCASVMYVQLDEFDRAAALLTSATATEHDPWLLAPLLAITDLGDLKVRGQRRARQLLEQGDYPDLHLAELASALGTIEMGAGSDRRARKLFRRSLRSPTENALAQAEWIWDRTGEESIDPTSAQIVPRAYEAQAARAAHEARWNEACSAAKIWLMDQPFSVDAALCGSSYAFYAEDWEAAKSLATSGLEANHDNPQLLNNLALGHLEAGEVEVGIQILGRARSVSASVASRALLSATEGLALFRAGHSELGRRRYQSAIDAFSRLKMRESVALATLMLAREEILHRTSEAERVWRRAHQLGNEFGQSDIQFLHEKVRLVRLETGSTPAAPDLNTSTKSLPTGLMDDPPELAPTE